MIRRTPLTIAVSAISLLLAANGFSQDSEKKIDPKAKGIMDAVAAHLASAKTLQVETDFKVKITPPPAIAAPPNEDQAIQRFSYSGPDQLSVVTQKAGRQGKVSAYYNKGQANIFFGEGDGIVEVKGLKSPSELFVHPDLGYQAEAGANMFLDQNIALKLVRDMVLAGKDWDKTVTALAYVGEKEVEGTKFHQVLMTHTSQAFGQGLPVPTAIWVTTGEKPLMARVVPDLSALIAQLEAQNPEAKGVKMEMGSDFKNWKVGEEIAPAEFAAPAAGDTKVFPAVAEFFQAMQGGAGAPDPGQALNGKDAPAVKLGLLAGGTFDLAEHKGKHVVILDFWATWCGPCVQAMPILMKVAKKFEKQGVRLIGVNEAEDKKTAGDFIKGKGWDLTVAMDTDSAIGRAYGVTGIPQTVIIGKDGKVKQVHVGLSPTLEATLTAELEAILAEEKK